MPGRRIPFTPLLAVALLATLAWASGAGSQELGFRVVVSDDNPVDAVSLEDLSQLFLKQKGKWDHGPEVKPVDQAPSTAVRARFSAEVFDKEVPWIKSYWQKQIFSGRGTPPPELASDREVLSFVRRHPGAIGYVTTAASPGDGVKTISVTR